MPTHDPKYLISDRVTIVVQVNGKVRANIDVPTGSEEAKIVQLAKSNDRVVPYIDKTIRKTIYVKNKLVNFVVN